MIAKKGHFELTLLLLSCIGAFFLNASLKTIIPMVEFQYIGIILMVTPLLVTIFFNNKYQVSPLLQLALLFLLLSQYLYLFIISQSFPTGISDPHWHILRSGNLLDHTGHLNFEYPWNNMSMGFICIHLLFNIAQQLSSLSIIELASFFPQFIALCAFAFLFLLVKTIENRQVAIVASIFFSFEFITLYVFQEFRTQNIAVLFFLVLLFIIVQSYQNKEFSKFSKHYFIIIIILCSAFTFSSFVIVFFSIILFSLFMLFDLIIKMRFNNEKKIYMNNTFIVIILFMTIGFIMYISSCLNDIFSFGNLLKTQYQTFYSNFLPQSELEANLVEMTSTTQPFPAFINNLKYFFYMVFCICGALYALLNIKRKNTLKSVFSISVGGFFLFLFIIANYFGSYMSSGRILILLLIFLSISSSSILYQFLFFNKKTIFKILFISFVGFYIIFNSIQIPSYILPSNELIRGPFNIDKNINWYHDTQQDVSVTFLEKFNIQSNINGQLAMPNYNYRESQKFNSSDIKYNKKIRTIYIVETGFANGHILNWNPNYSNIVKNQKFYNSGNIEISTT